MCRSWELQSNLSVNPAFLNCLTNNITLHISTNQKGRKRNLSQHKQIRKALAFRIIELVFDAEGHGVDFVFRYCNDEMAVVEGVPVSEMLNRSFYEVFENGDKKWLVTYADVALNGNKHILQDYSPEIDKTLTIYCFQPAPGYCACVLIPS